MTYSELQTQVASYLHRTDLTAQIPTFISLAESYLFRELHIKALEVSVDGVTVGGYAVLPADFGSVSRISITYAGSARTLDYIALADTSTGIDAYPKYYSMENGKLRLWGTGDGQTYTMYYVPALQPLSDTVTTNWLLDNAAELYLYAAAREGAKYVRNAVEVDRLTGDITQSLDSVKRFTERLGQPSTGSMQIKVRRG